MKKVGQDSYFFNYHLDCVLYGIFITLCEEGERFCRPHRSVLEPFAVGIFAGRLQNWSVTFRHVRDGIGFSRDRRVSVKSRILSFLSPKRWIQIKIKEGRNREMGFDYLNLAMCSGKSSSSLKGKSYSTQPQIFIIYQNIWTEKVLRWFPNKLDLEIPNPGSVTPIMGEKTNITVISQ